jgi:lambda family phage portal protein
MNNLNSAHQSSALKALTEPIDVSSFASQTIKSAGGEAAASSEANSPDSRRWNFSRFDSSIQTDPVNPDVCWYAPSRANFESAETSRLNQGHWSAVRDTPINDDLDLRLHTMRTRSNHEAWNNTSIEGLILQHSIAVAGDDGPLLDLQADDETGDAWCERAERLWEDWCEYSDAAGDWTLGSRIKNSWNRSCWTNGEWFDQLVYAAPQPGRLRLRLHAIEPQRIWTPSTDRNTEAVVLGIARDPMRNPIKYHVGKQWYGYGVGDWINAENILHGYDKVEADQARGVPWCQSGLPTAADLRDYDDQVMDAARSAADMAIIAQTKHPDAEYFATNETATYRRRRINHIAPGWEIAQLQPHQPAATYKEHRHERMGDLGRGKGVPSMVLRLDARDHNYSSARFDRSLLHASASHVRTTLYNKRLSRLVRIVLSEAILMGILPFPPSTYKISHIWPAMPQVDEDKAAKAETRYMKNGSLSYSDACVQRHGRRASDVIRIRQRDEKRLKAAGLPSVQEATATSSAQIAAAKSEGD